MKFLTIKDISIKLGISIRQAERINSDIKKHYKLRTKVTIAHLKDYLKIP